jgi:orotidine-5'-phosphate decarboxylase
MSQNFMQKLTAAWSSQNSLLCVGLDPDPLKMPPFLSSHKGGTMFAFCKAIVDATADLVCAFKPQIAYFSAYHAEDQLEQLISYIHENYPEIPVILDAKRADIGSTANQYAREAFERYNADAVTLNPYMGFDAIEPFLQYDGKGVFLLCRTSNASGDQIQNLMVENKPLYMKIAELSTQWNVNGQIGLVTGATYPQEIADIRKIVGDMPLLVPGIGAQGGDIAKTLQAGLLSDGSGLILNSSRAILYASNEDNFAHAARMAAMHTCSEVNKHI